MNPLLPFLCAGERTTLAATYKQVKYSTVLSFLFAFVKYTCIRVLINPLLPFLCAGERTTGDEAIRDLPAS